MEERKIITMRELEEFMESREGRDFEVDSTDTFGFSVDMVCTSVHFDKSMDDDTQYLCMIMSCGCGEIQIEPEIVGGIYLDGDETITLEFRQYLPDLEIRYR